MDVGTDRAPGRTNYGELTEIWFDGGFAVPGLKDKLLDLYERTQPNAVVFNGCGLLPGNKNAVIWIGTESGKPKSSTVLLKTLKERKGRALVGDLL